MDLQKEEGQPKRRSLNAQVEIPGDRWSPLVICGMMQRKFRTF
jgi:hypothetical protein